MEGKMKKQTTAKSKRQRKRGAEGKSATGEIATSLAAIEALAPNTPKAVAVVALLKTWLRDESGYDEETWPELKRALDEERAAVGARRLFRA